jgi:hypothetical protein
MITDSFFGTDAQQALLRRGRALYDLLAEDRRLSYYGRTVGVLRPDPDLLDRLIAIQGSSTCSDLTAAEADALSGRMAAQGRAVTRYACWEGEAGALHAADRILARHDLPDDIRVVTIDAETPEADLARLAEISLACGVLPIAGSVLRGTKRPGVGAVALDGAGRPVSCAAAAAFAHPDDPGLGRQC